MMVLIKQPTDVTTATISKGPATLDKGAIGPEA